LRRTFPQHIRNHRYLIQETSLGQQLRKLATTQSCQDKLKSDLATENSSLVLQTSLTSSQKLKKIWRQSRSGDRLNHHHADQNPNSATIDHHQMRVMEK